MKLLKLKEAVSASACTKSKRQEHLQRRERREIAANNSDNEPCCSNNVSKDFLSLPASSAAGTNETTTMYIFPRSPAITNNPQPVT